MKSPSDPRHQKRRKAVKLLFAETFTPQADRNPLVKKILSKQKEIDNKIQKAAPTWPVTKLNKVDLAILRLAVYELENKNAPPKVIIDEAVELAKEFGSENSPSFVNGVLGTIYKKGNSKMKSDKNKNPEELILKILAKQLGVEPSDIAREDSFSSDLQMNPVNITDFLQALSKEGYDISKIDLTEMETVNDLLEAIGSNDNL